MAFDDADIFAPRSAYADFEARARLLAAGLLAAALPRWGVS